MDNSGIFGKTISRRCFLMRKQLRHRALSSCKDQLLLWVQHIKNMVGGGDRSFPLSGAEDPFNPGGFPSFVNCVGPDLFGQVGQKRKNSPLTHRRGDTRSKPLAAGTRETKLLPSSNWNRRSLLYEVKWKSLLEMHTSSRNQPTPRLGRRIFVVQPPSNPGTRMDQKR